MCRRRRLGKNFLSCGRVSTVFRCRPEQPSGLHLRTLPWSSSCRPEAHKLLEMGDGLHLARETHACAARPATGVPVTMFSSWRLFSEELPTADIPGIMMRLGARHLNV